MKVCYKAKSLVDKVYMDSRHDPPGQFSQQDSVTVGWPDQPSGSETRIDKILIEDVCMCVYPVSVVETELYTYPWAPEGVRFALVSMGVFGSTYSG